jgi:FkbM family methyltransferase
MRRHVARYISRVSEYLSYGARAVAAGVPLWQLRTIRRAANVVAALPLLAPDARIVDVGANDGEWGSACARLFPLGRIVSFEPVPRYCAEAMRKAQQFSNWEVVNVGVGDTTGLVPIEVRGRCSSMKGVAGEAYAEWTAATPPQTGVETVRVDTLDRLLAERRFYPVDLLKVDAEGYEREILNGARETLKQTRQVLIEVRFYELFKGGPLFEEVHEILTANGFMLNHLKPCRGTCLWADATYSAALPPHDR